MKITILIIVIVIIVCVLTMLYLSYQTVETMINLSPVHDNVKWTRDSTCNYKMTQVFDDVLKEYGIKHTTEKDWTIYFPCTYNNTTAEIDKTPVNNPNQRVFIITNSEELSSKSNLWTNLVAKYGREIAKSMTPLSYVLYSTTDMALFDKEFDPAKIYIIKKNIQRQEGLKITKDKQEIIDGFKNGYVVAQELLQDPYIIRGRKTNMRFYVLIVCQNDEITAYVHKDGFMYYTKGPFVKNSTKSSHNITTGYIERWIYKINPLSHTDFKHYLDDSRRKQSEIEKYIMANNHNTNEKLSDLVFNRIYKLIAEMIYSMDHKICSGSKLKSSITFQLFGVDIALDDNLQPKIMEVNVGPNLGVHDERDGAIKKQVVRDIFKVIKVVPAGANGFMQIV